MNNYSYVQNKTANINVYINMYKIDMAFSNMADSLEVDLLISR